MASLPLILLEHGDGQQCRWEAGRHVCIWQTWMSVTFVGRWAVGEWACLLSSGHIWWQHNSPECKEWQMSECGQPFWEYTLQLSVNNAQQRIWRTSVWQLSNVHSLWRSRCDIQTDATYLSVDTEISVYDIWVCLTPQSVCVCVWRLYMFIKWKSINT